VRRNLMRPEEIRAVEAYALVDTGAVTFVLPSLVVERLGLARPFKQVAEYADGRREEVDVTEPVFVELLGRHTVEEALVLGDEVIVGGLTETVANAAVKDVTFMIVTDIEITEKARPGVIVRQDSQQDASQGVGGRRTQTSSEVTDVKKYRTRIVSTANKANLDYGEAAPQLTQGLVRSVSGLF
jgi:hypothetical protein